MKKRRWICMFLLLQVLWCSMTGMAVYGMEPDIPVSAVVSGQALTIGMLAGCGQKKDLSDGGEKKKLQKVTLNEVAHSIFYAPMYVAIEEGYFREEGIDLTLVTGFGADKTVTAVLAGEF